jgi:hypothetical protein
VPDEDGERGDWLRPTPVGSTQQAYGQPPNAASKTLPVARNF